MVRPLKEEVKALIPVVQRYSNMKKYFIFFLLTLFGMCSIESCLNVIGPQYELSKKEKKIIKIIEEDCSCYVRIDGDAKDLPNELRTKSLWLSLNYSNNKLNCNNLDSLKAKSKYYSVLFYRNGDKFKKYHDTLVVLFVSSHLDGEVEFVDCWKSFSYPLDSLIFP